MSPPHAVVAIEGFQAEWEQRAAELSAQHATHDEALLRGDEAIRELQQQLATALQRRDQLMAARDQILQAQRSLPAKRDAAERELLRSTLQAGLESVQAAQRRRERLAQMARDLAALLQADPELARKLADYQSFEASCTQITTLSAFPEFHRQALLEAQSQLATALQSYFELEQEIGRLRQTQPATLWLVIAELPGDMAGWVLPAAVDKEQSLDSLPLDGLTGVLHQALTGLTPGAQYVDGAWEHFTARLFGPLGTAIEQRVAQFNAALVATPDLAGLAIQVRALRCSPEAWAQAWDGPAALDMGWYTLDDLRSWSRRVEAGSNWGQQPRRLRTLLLRMLTNGAIAPEQVPAEQLWLALPEPHRSAMRAIIVHMCASGLLAGDPAGTVGVVPERLAEIEQIITRKHAPAWAAGQEPRPEMVG